MTRGLRLVFPRLYLLPFWQLAAGGILSLAIPSFREVGIGYFRSTAAVYVALAFLALCGSLSLSWGGTGAPLSWPEAAAEVAFVACACAYAATLWFEWPALRARLFTATLATGLLRLALAGPSLCGDRCGPAAQMIFSFAVTVPAAPLGTALSTMLLGHWYLVDRELSLAPLRRMHAFFVASLALQGFATLTTTLSLWALRGQLTVGPAAADVVLVIARLAVSPAGALLVAWLIWKTLQIPQTMAATGLAYIATLAVLVGQLLSVFVLHRSGLPL